MHTIQLHGSLSFSNIKAMSDQIRTQIKDHEAVLVEIIGMDKLDVCGLQLLISTQILIASQGVSCVLKSNDNSHRVNVLCQKLGHPPFSIQEGNLND